MRGSHVRICSLLFVVGFFLSGCASLLTADRQYLTVDTGSVEGARCSVVDDRARRWFVESTPGSIIIERGGSSITIACSRPGYQTAVRQIDGTFSPLLALNAWPFISNLAVTGGLVVTSSNIYTYILQGGLVLLGVGVDVSRGQHVSLPQKVSVPLVRPATAIDEGSPGPLSPRTVSPGEESQRLLEMEQEAPLSPFDEIILDGGG